MDAESVFVVALKNAALVTLIGILGCGSRSRVRAEFVDDPLWSEEHLAQAASRQFRRDLDRPIWSVGGDSATRSAEALIYPYLLVAAENQVFVVEADQVVVAFDLHGREKWRFGRKGGGPGEFQRIRDIRVWPGHGVLVTDGVLRRLTLLGQDGKLIWELPLRGMGTPESAVPAGDSTIMLLTAGPGYDTIRVLDPAGNRVGAITHPWPGLSGVPYLSAQYSIAGPNRNGVWAQMFVFGDGWFPFQGNHSTGLLGGYVEHTEFPAVAVQGDSRLT